MPTIEIRHQARRAGQDRTKTEVAGAITVTGRVGSYPAGSFGLRHIDSFHSSPSPVAAQRRMVFGSVRGPNDSYGNTVLLGVIITGTTGSRSAAQASIGSKAGAGTGASAYFLAYGY
ncbi:MAG: hypothetical protein ACRDHY_06945 [Anaerolineales bacterium]